MNNLKISILFYLQKNRTNKLNKCPIRCRITFLKKRKEFATGLFIPPIKWDSKFQKVKTSNNEYEIINTQLSLIKQKINQAFLFLQMQGREFTIQDIYLKYKGETPKEQKTVIDIINYHNNRLEKLIGIEATYTSWEKYHQTKKHIIDFLQYKYHKKDYLLKNLNESFLYDFEYYLQTEKKFKPSTIYKTIQRFRKMIKLGISLDYIKKDPFMLFKVKRYKKEIVYLNTSELNKLVNYTFTQTRLQQVKDLFIFCCYTGLAYKEMSNLKKENIITNFDDNLWIKMIRQKTNKTISIPLLPPALVILNKYQNENELFPKISNQKFNSYLKEIAEIVGIQKHLTHHIARKTFATTVLLYNGVSMEIVSELLGHSKMSITQESYGKVVQRKVSEQIAILRNKL